ncbi:MAG: hypothetical protein CL881_07725 [Dehalococcoidia bacterium]|jgi:hypothetical protein|nr:hypothetical protein [Dehalococcoidia bacterium]|tara:strand:- start:1786 stop:2046 length:261 start_codon:yes stop_codon:yes gene_type:complete
MIAYEFLTTTHTTRARGVNTLIETIGTTLERRERLFGDGFNLDGGGLVHAGLGTNEDRDNDDEKNDDGDDTECSAIDGVELHFIVY